MQASPFQSNKIQYKLSSKLLLKPGGVSQSFQAASLLFFVLTFFSHETNLQSIPYSTGENGTVVNGTVMNETSRNPGIQQQFVILQTNLKSFYVKMDKFLGRLRSYEDEIDFTEDFVRYFGRKQPRIQTEVLGHSLVRSLVCSHCSLVCLLWTARFTRALHCTHSFARSLAPLLVGQ